MPSVEGLESRRAALKLLDSVLRQGRTLDSAASSASHLPPSDRALAIAIAGETLRRLPDLDSLIDGATRKRLPDDSKARAVLRMALAQAIALDTPHHAVVATALPLVDGGPRRLVHGVLGTLLRRGLPKIDSPTLPPEVEQRWTEAWGEEIVSAAQAAIGHRPPLDLSFADQGEAQAYAVANGGTSLAPRHVRLASSGAVTDLPGFGDGRWWVQDLAASLPARLLPGKSTLDLCAAPGGKTMQLAAAGHDVTALDLSWDRLERLSDNLARTGLAAHLVAADALDWTGDRRFDSVLLDAPCSATGTFRRHPEVLYRARPRIIAESANLQARLIRKAAGFVAPGGTLVYSVCSLEPEEGESVVSAFLADNKGFEPAPPKPGELPGFVPVSDHGWVRILPGLIANEGGLDGFFVARLVARGD